MDNRTVVYETIPEEYDWSTKFPNWILAYCPDIDTWFATNERFFYYEYPMEFPDEESAIEYFKEHAETFLSLEKEMDFVSTFAADGIVFLEKVGEIKAGE